LTLLSTCKLDDNLSRNSVKQILNEAFWKRGGEKKHPKKKLKPSIVLVTSSFSISEINTFINYKVHAYVWRI